MSPVALTQLELPDYDLGLRGKLIRSEKLERYGKTAFCTIVYGLDAVDGVADTPISSAANGFPDAFAQTDESTRVELPWRRSTEAVIADLFDEDGVALPESPRTLLSNQIAGFAELGLEPMLGFEYECYVFHADDDVLRRGEYARLRPLGRAENGYSISRHTESADLLGEFMDRMDSIGINVEAMHSEIGPGFFEFALAPMPALRSADSAARARQYFRDLCAEHGLIATFMSKFRMDISGSGGHIHQSLAREGVNQFSDGAGGLTELARAYLGGLLVSMADYSALTNPLLNSYKRLRPGMYVAERSTWGWDTRNAACRVIANAGSSATRIEHRRPGADASPYLSAAAVLAGGLEGVRGSIDPGPALEPGDDLASTGERLPTSLAEATERFRASDRARRMFGDRFVDCYSATRDFETAAFESWWQSHISDFELGRSLDRI